MNNNLCCVKNKEDLCICTRQLILVDTSVNLYRLGTWNSFFIVFKQKEYRFILTPYETQYIIKELAFIVSQMKNNPPEKEHQYFVWYRKHLSFRVTTIGNQCGLKLIRKAPFYRELNISLKSFVAVVSFLQSVQVFTNSQNYKYILEKMKSG